MAIYQEVIAWSQSRSNFIKDALRRIISNPTITQSDIDELVLLLKKENGDSSILINPIPIADSHIPVLINAGTAFPKLISIKNPINICALHDEGHLQFAETGLTIIYGNNGSGKSSYSRILKKLCWSRNPSVELKKNVFVQLSNRQQVDFIINIDGVITDFRWKEGEPVLQALSSIYVFDDDCGNVYLNKENPTDYKPVGIDLLENLIPILNQMSRALDKELALLITKKPNLEPPFTDTATGQWYNILESLSKQEIDDYIKFEDADRNRKQKLSEILITADPQQEIQNLTALKGRIENYTRQFALIEEQFNSLNVEEIKGLRNRFESIKQAYDIITPELDGLNTIKGFGSQPWRTLWEAAKNFAFSNGMSEEHKFPSAGSLKKCVLCQQDLDEIAQERLKKFNDFVSNDISKQLQAIEREIQQKIMAISSIKIPAFVNVSELSLYISDFPERFASFEQAVNLNKDILSNYLQKGGDLNITNNLISPTITNLLPDIDDKLNVLRQLLKDRKIIIAELNELTSKEFLFNHKSIILQYYDEFKYKTWIRDCQAQLNTVTVSKKIGELMENQAVNLQHQEFIKHLKFFNEHLSTKVLLAKTRTSQGNTFQKCSLTGVSDTINSVLSEGEQKIIALSNFLAECTIDGRKNTIVFDDPVNSLDMDYRDLIACKLAELSRDRQVIVLTHDLSFLRLLIDAYKETNLSDCRIIGIAKYENISGITSDEIPYLAKNVQERIDSIRRILAEHDALSITDAHGRETQLDAARKRFRMLLERSVEEILSNKAYERFSKNIHLKKGNLSSYIVTEKSDVDFLLGMFGKYSVTEHDGGTSIIPQLPSKLEIQQDVSDYSVWKDSFKAKLKAFKDANNYN